MNVSSTARVAALVAFVVLAGVLIVMIVATTPWHPLAAVPGGRTAPTWPGDFTAAERAHEVSYHRAIRPPVYLGLGAGLIAIAVLGLTPLGARLVELVARPFGGGWIARAALGVLAVSLAVRLASLPFDMWAEHTQRRYGLSTQTWGSWLVDQGKGLGIAAVVLAAVSVGAFAVVRRTPSWWWAWAAAGAAVLTVLMSFLYPVLIEPVFNHFSSMPDGPLRTELLDLARRDGVSVHDVVVADASRRTTAENAYVSGFGRTRRIVLYDTLLKASPEEVTLVVAHELGHAKRNDVGRATALGAIAAAAGVCLLFLAMTWEPLLRRAGVQTLTDPRSIALALFVVAAMNQLTAPAWNLVSRRIEARADVHSLDLTADPATFTRVERRLALSNLSDLDPPPLLYGLFATHPSTTERIAMARDWARLHDVAPPGPLMATAAATAP